MKSETIITGLIALNGGQLVGKTRLQKEVYLLQECGIGDFFDFEYHYFGPFSAELAEAADFAEVSGMVRVEEKYGHYDVPYSEFTTGVEEPERLGKLDATSARSLLRMLDSRSAVTLELAATLRFLRNEGVAEADLDDQVATLKPQKASRARLAEAHDLLRELGLER